MAKEFVEFGEPWRIYKIIGRVVRRGSSVLRYFYLEIMLSKNRFKYDEEDWKEKKEKKRKKKKGKEREKKKPQFICAKELYYNVSTIKKRKKGRKGKKGKRYIYKAMFAFVRFIISPSDRPTTTYNILSAECDNKSRN